jgi:hypothetical protein
MIRPPTPIDQLVANMSRLIDLSDQNPDIRGLLHSLLDGIVGATAMLWMPGPLREAEHRRMMQEALTFYAEGGTDGGERARMVFTIQERDWQR